MKLEKNNIERREFIHKGAGLVGLLALAPDKSRAAAKSSRLRVALVGTGSRGCDMWGKRLVHPFAEYIEIVALCDINPKRLKAAREYIGTDADLYMAKDFDKMIQEKQPDAVILTTPDCFHVDYAIRAMELGCDVICEKPVATTAEQCQRLLDTEYKTGKKVTVTFNVRHDPSAIEVKKQIITGKLGKIISMEFHEFLNFDHGASYFRRWHGKTEYSGSLLVHKASHHFDQINWWLNADPVEVTAHGKLAFYGKNNAFRAQNCRKCSHVSKCKFYWDISKNEYYQKLFLGCEDFDGYYRDGCVWDNDINGFDSVVVDILFDNDVIVSYTLDAYLPYEGQVVAINGESGRLDAHIFMAQPWKEDKVSEFRYTETFGESTIWSLPRVEEGHLTADNDLKTHLFEPSHPDPLLKMAGSREGVMSSLVGIAARKSIETGKSIKIKDLVDFPLYWKA